MFCCAAPPPPHLTLPLSHGLLPAQAWDHVLPSWHTWDVVAKSGWGALGAATVLGVVAMGIESKRKGDKDAH